MIKKRLSNILFLPIIFGFVFFTSIEIASADDLCKGACQTKYSKCQRVCDGDTDCLSDCQDAHSQCLNKCGGGTSRSEGSDCGGDEGYGGDRGCGGCY